MDIQTLLAEVKQKQETKYVPCSGMPVTLRDRLVEIKDAEGIPSMSKLIVLAARWFVSCYDKREAPQGVRGEIAEGGEGVEEVTG